MPDPAPITIVGGGLAGLTLGIGLRQVGVGAQVWEAAHYPRHKVCGEFISGAGLGVLERLGLRDLILKAGGCWAREAAFYVTGQPPLRLQLSQPALCVSRYVLDQLLADELRRRGGALRERERWSGTFDEPGVVRANGHRVQAAVAGWRWFGLKVQARGVPLAADLELHLVPDGYVGLCRLADRVNVCGLFRSQQPIPELREHWRAYLLGPTDSVLRSRLAGAELAEETFRAVAGLDLRPQRARAQAGFALGDALTMIPPATGNGMSLALESADLALGPLVQYSRGELGWDAACRAMADAADQRFAARLRVASWLHGVLFQLRRRNLLLLASRRFPFVLRWLFAHTR